jgi:ParB-like chromosome segregation protein Spo0J
VVRELSRKDIAKVALVENLQRKNLNPVEEAEAIEEVVHVLGVSVDEIAGVIGKSPAYVYSRRRVLGLPVSVRREIAEGRLGLAHALQLVRLPDARQQVELAFEVVGRQLTLAQTEALVHERLNATLSRDRSKQREEAYNRKLRTLRKESGKRVVAYNEFDSLIHQRVWNLRFKECKGCPLKGLFLNRELRVEDLCIVPTCYRSLERKEHSTRDVVAQAAHEGVRHELEKILHGESVQVGHLQLLVFSFLELLGALADSWRQKQGLPASNVIDASDITWSRLGSMTMDDLVTAAIELSVMHVATSAYERRLPPSMPRDLAVTFGLDSEALASAVDGGNGVTPDAVVSAATADLP